MSNNHITDEGIQYFQQLPAQTLLQIRRLDLSQCGIRQRGLNILIDLIPVMSSLTTLYIGDNPVDEGGTMKLLQELGKYRTIQRLEMEHIPIGESDITALSHVIRPPLALKILSIGHYGMSPQLVEQLMRTIVSSSLKELYMYLPLSPSPLDYNIYRHHQ